MSELLDKAQEHANAAQHILSFTYASVENPKLFLSALQHIFLSMNAAMKEVLTVEQQRGNVKKFPSNFMGRYSTFRLKCAKPLGFTPKHVEQLQEIRNILVEHKASPIEFVRKDKLVICNNDYDMKILTEEALTDYLNSAQEFLGLATQAVNSEEPLSMGTVSQ